MGIATAALSTAGMVERAGRELLEDAL